jgi:tyrosine-protein kinase Etk/Wzc
MISAHKIENKNQTYSEDGVNIGILSEKKWTIACITLFTLSVTLIYIFTATPVYMTDSLLQVEEKAPLEQELGAIISEMLLSDEILTETEIEIIRSRNIIGKVVERLKLDIIATPRYFPIIGKPIAHGYADDSGIPSDPLIGISLFAWGGEHICVELFNVPDDYIDKELKITALEDKQYLLCDPEGNLLIKGVVGEPAHLAKPDKTLPLVSILVSELHAGKDTQFLIKKTDLTSCIKNLQQDLSIKEKGSQTGMLFMSLEGENKEKIVEILNTLMEIYVEQNFEKKSSEIAKTLNFIKSQLPGVKEKLNAAEAKLNEYKLQYGHIDLNIEARALINKIAAVKKQLSELELQSFDYAKKYTLKHRSMLVLKQKINQLKSELEFLNNDLKTLPNVQLGAIKAQRDVKVSEQLYLLLLNKSRELMVAQAGITGNARIIDRAVMPNEPVEPKKSLLLIIGLLTGLFAGVAFVIIGSNFFGAIDNPAIIEEQLGLHVYTIVPFSSNQKKAGFLAAHYPGDIAIESLRTLRTGLLFDLSESSGNIVSFTGASPECGKSFISLNFSRIIAEAGKRVLLIDADLRRGQLHRYLNCKRSPGLSDVITGKADPNKTIHVESDLFSFLPTGLLPANPSELLLFKQFEIFLNNVSKQFDLVIIDGPPAFISDSLTISRLAGINFYIIRSKQNSVQEVKQNLRHLDLAGVKIQGCILNGIKPASHKYGYAKYKYT